MNVTVPSELEQFIQTQIESGRYRSANDVVAAALRLLQMEAPEIEPLHARVDDELASLTRGDGARAEAVIETPEGGLEESQEDERPLGR